MIEEYLASKRPIVEELLSHKPDCFFSEQYLQAIHYTLLCFADDSPLHDRFQNIDQKRSYAENQLNSTDVIHNDLSLYLYVLEEYLIKFVHSYRYEFLLTCHILLSENNKELRKPISGVTDADKRAKTADIRSRLLQNNKETIEMIDSLNKVIFGSNEDLKKKYDTERLTIEQRVKKTSK